MRKIYLILVVFTITSTTALWASDNSYKNYNNIVSDLQQQLKTKKETAIYKLKNSSYSLAAGLNTQFHNINGDSALGIGVGAELGVYNLISLPLKFGLIYSKGEDIKEITAKVKTDYSFYKYNFFDLKVGLSAGIGTFSNTRLDFTSFYLSPSIAGFYQVNKIFDVSLNIEYLFHSSNKISNHFNPSINAITYF